MFDHLFKFLFWKPDSALPQLMSNASYCHGMDSIIRSHGDALSGTITMAQTAGIFFLYVAGLVISCLAFLAELFGGKRPRGGGGGQQPGQRRGLFETMYDRPINT